MKLSTLLVGIASILFLAAASERTYMGHQVVDKEFPIDGGRTKWLPVTEAGPIPAETQAFKIEVAGVSVRPSILLSPRRAALSWQFALTLKTPRFLERVVVEEVYPSPVASIVVVDKSPSLKHGIWFGGSASVEPNPSSTAWLFSDKDAVFVFRFTITPAAGTDVILYQPVWFPRPAQEAFRQAVRQINGGQQDAGAGWSLRQGPTASCTTSR